MQSVKVLLFIFALCTMAQAVYAADQKSKASFMLLSPAFEASQAIPKKYACNGGDTNPPLEIYNPPAKTKSFAITLENIDAPEGVWSHWVVYNISAEKLSIAENSIPGEQLFNDFGQFAYNGPCPIDDRTYRFMFKAYALDAILEVNEGGTIKDLRKAIKGHVLAEFELNTTYRNYSF